MRWLLALLVLLLLGLQYRLWFAEGSLAERTRLESQLQSLTRANRELLERNAVLEREVLELQTGNSTVEQRAREQLGLVRKGETFFQIVPSARERGTEQGAEPETERQVMIPEPSLPPAVEPVGDPPASRKQPQAPEGDR